MLLTQPVGGARNRLQIRFHPSDHSDLRAAWTRSGLLLLLAAWAPSLAAAADEHASEDAELLFNGNQYLRGDEANLLQPLNAYAVVGLRGEYRLSSHFTMFARIENLFDTGYETFGLLGQPNGAPGLRNDENPRFVSPGGPRAGWVGVRVDL